MEIVPPPLGQSHPEREIACEKALEPAFSRLRNSAEAAGWTTIEMGAALVGLVETRVAMRRANADTDEALASARRKVIQ